jgi:hypothetical protein
MFNQNFPPSQQLHYLKFTLDLELTYKKHKQADVLHGFVDADWAGDIVDRQSTSGYIFKVFSGVV